MTDRFTSFRRMRRGAIAVAVTAALAGTACAAGMPEIPVAEREIPSAEREAWRTVIGWPTACEEAYRATIGGKRSGMVFHDLGGGHCLVEIACASGAYQGFAVFAGIEMTRKSPGSRMLSFPIFESRDNGNLERRESGEVWGTVTFDPGTRRLTVLNRFRGSGDCGTHVVYRFRNGTPELEEARAKPECDGRGAEHPEKWPLIERPCR